MDFIPISKKALFIWRARLVAVAFLAALLISLIFNFFSIVWNILTGAWIIAFIYFYAFYYPIKYHKMKYKVNDDIFCVNCGVIYTRQKYIYIKNIHYVILFSSPLERHFGVTTLIVVAAGGTIFLYSLNNDDAAKLRSTLSGETAHEK